MVPWSTEGVHLAWQRCTGWSPGVRVIMIMRDSVRTILHDLSVVNRCLDFRVSAPYLLHPATGSRDHIACMRL